jgi:hypothetical protein
MIELFLHGGLLLDLIVNVVHQVLVIVLLGLAA